MKRCIALLTLVAVALSASFAQAPSQETPAPEAAAASAEWYIGKPIKDVRFEGLVVVTKDDFGTLVKDFKGRLFDDVAWAELLSRVYEFDYFLEVAPEAVPADATRQSVIIVFKVKEKPAVDAITVVGNAGLRTTEILDAASVKTQTIFNQSRLRLDEIAIRQLYQTKGYTDVRVVASSAADENGSIDVTFTVEEGIQNIVDKIMFEGVTVISASTLKGEMTLKEKGLFQPGQFTEAKFEESRSAIELYYKNHGYVDARVADVRRDSVADEKTGARRLTLTFVVEEGRKYTFDGMSFAGNAVFTTEQLAACVRHKKGAVINYGRVMQDQARAADLYFENGYIFNGFSLQETRNEELGSIAYLLVIEERDQAHIEDVIIRGNTKTEDYVIRRLIPLESGDVFSKTKVLEGLRSLYNTQYFSSIAPSYEQGSQELYVDLAIDVVEQSTASVQFGLTYTPTTESGELPVVGIVDWSDINFLGRGQTVSVKTNLAVDSQDLTLSFQDDWLFGQRLTGSIDFSFEHELLSTKSDSSGVVFDYDNPLAAPDPYDSWEEYLAAGKTVPDAYLMNYDTWTFSLGLATGYRFNTPFGVVGFVPGTVHDLGMVTYDAEKDRPFDETIYENYRVWKLSNTVYLRSYVNNLDLWYDPSNGYYVSQKFGFTGWFEGEINKFMSSTTRLEGYVTLFDIPVFESWSFKAVLGAHTRFTAYVPQFGSDSVTISSDDGLSIDGTFVGRGWSDIGSYDDGDALWDNWLEIRVPVVPGMLSLDGFFDAAALSTTSGLLDVAGIVDGTGAYQSGDDIFDIGLHNMAFSVGAGLRFTILQFPFRLYFAKRFVFSETDSWKWAEDDKWDFVLSVTQSLN